MKIVTINLDKDELKIFYAYAAKCEIPLSKLFKMALEEKIENEYDLEAIAQYEEKLKNGQVNFFSHNEVKKKFGF